MTVSIRPEDLAQPLGEFEGFPATIDRLAALPLPEYERARAIEAKNLGMRLTELDNAVKGARKAGQVTEGKKAMFGEVNPWPNAVDLAQLLEEVRTAIHRFIICDQDTAVAATLWIAMTWVIDHVQVAPIAVITAPEKRCGKSQLLDVIGRLSCRPLVASNISPAAVYRVIEAYCPTLLIDEADSFMKENEELRGILNSGHTRPSAYVIRSVGDDHEPRQFSTWGAKAIAGIGRVAGTLMDRAVVLTLRRKLPTEKCDRIRYAQPQLFTRLAAMLARFAMDSGASIASARPCLPENLNDRAQDNWEALLAIADIAGGNWPTLARTAALNLSGVEHEALSTTTELLSDIREVFATAKAKQISTASLLSALITDDLKPWSNYFQSKPMTPRQLAKCLGGFGIHSKNLKMPGNVVVKGYDLAQFEDVFERYLVIPAAGNQPPPATNEHRRESSGSGSVAVAEPTVSGSGPVAGDAVMACPSATGRHAPSLGGSGVAQSEGRTEPGTVLRIDGRVLV